MNAALRTLGLVALAVMELANRAPAQEDPVSAYLDARARYDSLFSARQDTLVRRDMAVAIKDLETRLRALTGPVSFGGNQGTFNAGWIVRDWTEGGHSGGSS